MSYKWHCICTVISTQLYTMLLWIHFWLSAAEHRVMGFHLSGWVLYKTHGCTSRCFPFYSGLVFSAVCMNSTAGHSSIVGFCCGDPRLQANIISIHFMSFSLILLQHILFSFLLSDISKHFLLLAWETKRKVNVYSTQFVKFIIKDSVFLRRMVCYSNFEWIL